MIKLIGISKSYDDKTILDNFSLHIHSGEFVAVVGRSGSGKSTLLNIIGLLENYDKGTVIIDGEKNIPPQSAKATKILRTKINYLFQNFALIDEETVFNNLKLALRYVKGDKKKLIASALSKVGLKGYERKKIYQLSGGEQQRVAIARIILKPAKIILADEPTGSLDQYNKEMVIHMLKTFRQEGKTVLVVTHDNTIASCADRVITMKE